MKAETDYKLAVLADGYSVIHRRSKAKLVIHITCELRLPSRAKNMKLPTNKSGIYT